MKRDLLHLFLSVHCLLLIASCEKEIDIDYHKAEERFVAEASITQEGTTVKLSKSQAMDDNVAEGHYVEDAKVSITSSIGATSVLEYNKKGVYTSRMRGIPGWQYTIDIEIGNQHYTSNSIMQETPILNNCNFVWKELFSERLLLLDVRLQDRPNENNYYFLHIYRNGIGFRWAVINDRSNPGQELQQLFTCGAESTITTNGDEDVIRENDKIRLEIRAIDKRAYDYLYSLQIMSGTSTNPIDNFTGGLLGYFSAYSYINEEIVFHIAEVLEEDSVSQP